MVRPRNRRGNRTPGVFQPGADYSTDEHATGVNWIDGKPIFRIVVQLAGGMDVSTGASAALALTAQTLVNGYAVVRDLITANIIGAALGLTIGGGSAQPGIEVNTLTGAISVTHTGVDTTGATVFCILEYTKG